jgi:hypothetical protein
MAIVDVHGNVHIYDIVTNKSVISLQTKKVNKLKFSLTLLELTYCLQLGHYWNSIFSVTFVFKLKKIIVSSVENELYIFTWKDEQWENYSRTNILLPESSIVIYYIATQITVK